MSTYFLIYSELDPKGVIVKGHKSYLDYLSLLTYSQRQSVTRLEFDESVLFRVRATTGAPLVWPVVV